VKLGTAFCNSEAAREQAIVGGGSTPGEEIYFIIFLLILYLLFIYFINIITYIDKFNYLVI
jgi:hypothetical protein